MLPSKYNGRNVLKCNLCGRIKQLNDELIDSYKFTTKIEHPKGSEFKNLEKMKNWKEKEIYNKFE